MLLGFVRMARVAALLLEMPCSAVVRRSVRAWTQCGTDAWRCTCPGCGTLQPPISTIGAVLLALACHGRATYRWWKQAGARLVHRCRPTYTYCCRRLPRPARATVGGRRTVRVRWAVPIESACWTGHTFQLYWRAVGEHHWRMVPLEHTYYYMDKGCMWVEGVVWEEKSRNAPAPTFTRPPSVQH